MELVDSGTDRFRAVRPPNLEDSRGWREIAEISICGRGRLERHRGAPPAGLRNRHYRVIGEQGIERYERASNAIERQAALRALIPERTLADANLQVRIASSRRGGILKKCRPSRP